MVTHQRRRKINLLRLLRLASRASNSLQRHVALLSLGPGKWLLMLLVVVVLVVSFFVCCCFVGCLHFKEKDGVVNPKAGGGFFFLISQETAAV